MSTTDALLALLCRGPAHGYDLKVSYDRWFDGGRPLAFGQVYSTLARLLRDGLVEVAHTGSEGGPERTVYALTPAGGERVDRWLQTPVRPEPAEADELIRKVVAAFRLDADPAGLVARQRAVHLRRMRRLTEPDDGPETTPDTSRRGGVTGGLGAVSGGRSEDQVAEAVVDLMRDHALAHLDADLRWLELAESRMVQARLEPGRHGSGPGLPGPPPGPGDSPGLGRAPDAAGGDQAGDRGGGSRPRWESPSSPGVWAVPAGGGV